MSSMGDAVTAAVLTALATTTVLELTVKPWLEGRSTRIKAAIQARHELSSHAAAILAACDRIEAANRAEGPASSASPTLSERSRWWERVDEATKALVDGYEAGGASVTWARLRPLLREFAIMARWVTLSQLPDEYRVAYLRALAEPAEVLFFSTWPAWLRDVASPKSFNASQAQLRSAIDQIASANVLAYDALAELWKYRESMAEAPREAADEDPVIDP